MGNLRKFLIFVGAPLGKDSNFHLICGRIGLKNSRFGAARYFGKDVARYYVSNGENCTPLRGFFIYLSLG